MHTGESVINQGTPLVMGFVEVPAFDQEALLDILKRDQAGETTFQEFLTAAWNAGVWGYDVDFDKHTVTYMGARGELYTEPYAPVDVPEFDLST